MKSACAYVEAKFLEALRGVVDIGCEGLLEVAASGEVKQEDMTVLQVRVYNLTQLSEALPMCSLSVELRLNVEQAESANGRVFGEAYDAVAVWLQQVMLGDSCTALSSEGFAVDGLQVAGGDADFDPAAGCWYSLWNLTLTGRLTNNTEVK